MTAEPQAGRPPSIVIGVGASAGGVEALRGLVGRLPPDFPGAVIVVLHVSAAGTSVLPEILSRAGNLPALAAREGVELAAGCVYVAPPDRHVLVRDGRLALSAGPRVNGHRPAIDPTFASLAALGTPAAGVILSGTLDDGTAGLRAIKASGGGAYAQDPAEAAYDGMIRSAQRHVELDAVLPLDRLGDRLVAIAHASGDPAPPRHPDIDVQTTATRFTCPDCGGVLWREEEGDIVRYTCSVGHAYSPGALEAGQARDVEHALWTATRLLGDRHAMLEEMAARSERAGQRHSAGLFRTRAEEAEAVADTLRSLIERARLAVTSDAAGPE